MDPSADPETDVIAKILADMFSAGFESLDEVEEIGFDLSHNFAIFMHIDETNQENPLAISAAVHISNQETVLQMLGQEEGNLIKKTYQDITYLTKSNEENDESDQLESFLFLDNVMVFTSNQAVCHQVIETYRRESKSILKSANFSDLEFNSLVNDVAGYFAIQKLVENNQEMIEKVFERAVQETGQGEILMVMSKWLSQIHSLSLTLQHDKGEVVLTPFLQMVDGSEISTYIQPTNQSRASQTGSENFPLLKYIPEGSGMAYGMNLNTDKIAEVALWSMKMAGLMMKLSGT